MTLCLRLFGLRPVLCQAEIAEVVLEQLARLAEVVVQLLAQVSLRQLPSVVELAD